MLTKEDMLNYKYDVFTRNELIILGTRIGFTFKIGKKSSYGKLLLTVLTFEDGDTMEVFIKP